MKICVSSYSFNKLMMRGEMTQFDTVQKAKEIGFDGIEFAELHTPDGMTDTEYARKLKQEAERCELPIVSFVFAADLINGTGGRTPKQEVEHVKMMVDIAEILGAEVVRHDALYSLGHYKSFDMLLPLLAERVNEISEYAKSKGIKTSVENHGFICQAPDRCERLFNAVRSDNFGILCDMGNFLCADVEPAKAVATVAPYVVLAHAKDFYLKSGSADAPGRGYMTTLGGNYIKGTVIGHGIVPVKQCLGILKRAGYDGFVSLEFEGMEENIDALEIGLENLHRYIAELER